MKFSSFTFEIPSQFPETQFSVMKMNLRSKGLDNLWSNYVQVKCLCQWQGRMMNGLHWARGMPNGQKCNQRLSFWSGQFLGKWCLEFRTGQRRSLLQLVRTDQWCSKGTVSTQTVFVSVGSCKVVSECSSLSCGDPSQFCVVRLIIVAYVALTTGKRGNWAP